MYFRWFLLTYMKLGLLDVLNLQVEKWEVWERMEGVYR